MMLAAGIVIGAIVMFVAMHIYFAFQFAKVFNK